MSETAEQVATHRSPLHETHIRLGATMKVRDGWLVPASYGDELFEYAAVREGGSGLIDLSSRARFQVSGSEAVQFLNGLITNDVKALSQNRWMPAAFPNVQGRLIASVRVARLDDGFMIDTEAATRNKVLETIQRFTLAGDFHVAEITDQTALLSVQGKLAAGTVRTVLGEAAAEIPNRGTAQVEWQQKQSTVLRATHTAEDGFDLIVSADDAQALWDALTNAGARPVGHDALEILRIEAGLPRYGVDMDESIVITEALEDAVSYTKGCYVGQEIIARIKYRGHVAKRLTGIAFDRLVKPGNDAKIRSIDDKEIGRITSTTLSPHLGRTIALGYVKYDYVAPGTEVKILSLGWDLAGRVTELPFVRGSWYEPRT
jgi:aminomethyltransferase